MMICPVCKREAEGIKGFCVICTVLALRRKGVECSITSVVNMGSPVSNNPDCIVRLVTKD